MKKYISIFLVFVLAMSLCPGAFVAADTYDYLVEAENYTSTNFESTSGVLAEDTTLSGGKYISLYTTKSGEYYAEYSVSVSQAGVYDIFVASSPVDSGSWSSKIYMSINGGSAESLTGKLLSNTGNSRIKWYSIGGANLKAGANTIRIIIRDKSDTGYYSAFIDCLGLNKSEFRIEYITGDAVMNVFEGGDSVTMSVVANAPASSESTHQYTLKDVYGNVVKSGNFVWKSGEKKANITFNNIDFGYYTLEASTLSSAFSVVKPMAERTSYSDTPFAIDTAFSDSGARGVDQEDYAKVLGLSGVSWIRDRFRMKDSVTYTDGEYKFGNGNIKSTAELVNPYGIQVSNAAEYMPSNFVNDYGTYLPDDLIETYKFWKSAANYYNTSVDNWEILNEVDRGGVVASWDSPDLYAAFMKAAAVGINDGSGAMVSAQGAAMDINDQSEYGKILIRNGIFDYSAIDNAHYHKDGMGTLVDYYEFDGLNGVIDRVKEQKSSNSSAPIWITEAGIALKAAEGVELTGAQQLVQAKYLVTSTVESIASGTDKQFFFVGPRYHESEKSWGMMSEETYMPYMYASYSAQCAMTDILGAGIYKGVIDKGNSNVSAYLFNNGSKKVIVAWSKAGEQTVSFDAAGTIYDMWGNELAEIIKGGSVTLNSEPIYIVCNSNNESVINNRRIQMTAKKKELDDAKRVILLQKYSDVSRGGSRTDGYMISSTENTVTLEVANLSENTMTGRITYNTENGWKLDKEYVDVTVSPMSVKTVSFTITPANGATTDYLSFVGTFNGKTTSPSTAKLVEVKDGIITLEAETDAKSQKGFSSYTEDENQGLKILTTTADEYKIDFEIVSADGGVYDLWTLGGILNYEWCSNHIIRVNGKEITPSPKNTTDILYWSEHNAIGWNSFNDVRLTKGLNNIEFSVSTTRNSGDSYIVSALDKLVFVPKGLVGYREAENFTTKTGLYYTKDESPASGGNTMRLFTYDIENPITNNSLSYDFVVNEDGKYDVWVLSSQANVSWLTKWKVGFDGATPGYPSSSLQEVKDVVDIGNQSLYWYRLQNDVSLTRGIHTVKFEGSEKRTNENDYMFHIMDAVVIVKETSNSSWSNGWKPANTTGNIQNNKIDVLKKVLLTEYDLGNITDSITLPKDIDGATISWSSSNASVVSGDGVVNRPNKGNGDASVTLTAVIDVDGKTSSATYNLTVKQLTDENRIPELQAEFESYKNGYSAIQMYVKNTDVIADENGEMPAVVVAKYDKTKNEFIGFVGEQNNMYTNEEGDTFVVDGNKVTCHITGANPDNIVTFAVYKEGFIPGKETIAYVNEYYPTRANSDIDFSFKTDMGDSAYRIVINKNGKSTSKIIHIFEGQTIIYDDSDTLDDRFIKNAIGKRIINTKGEAAMPLWEFPAPENEEDVIYKVFLWEWNSLKPLVECVILNN